MMYEARLGFDPRSTGILGICALFVVVALLVPDMPVALQVVTIVFFGGGGVLLAVGMASRKLALRVDEDGVTLGGNPLRRRATTVFVSWSEIAAIVLFRQRLSHGATMRYIGVQRHAGLPPLPSAAGRTAQAASRLIPHVPPDVVAASRAISGWRLDEDRLIAALRHHAPHVRLIDAG
ncbi:MULTISPECIES: hypothetical protein [unclassified Nocardia]|uniref:hypothetical protein n=1 Tax=unclassified Nocardia TaxID=2637762 RepID=UPI0024A9F641|nr:MULTISPECIES: hypothetical protein [unclassified Nocardia]